ncbi:heme ABC transporter ATP-binding protein [Zooshikella harenae]|uniref:Heme ABC transporter ATP-binding protein n=1 Tax=Zooshikella harenae TaxID=2827238 RepID=A0ABS5Z5U7_9GAMM|nr:heme ABC transporter ATP-binding protein [Zooshikella harenae]MBU2709445.1 heme ABC transporter ATP-binding protein [Zooshikella harenae]
MLQATNVSVHRFNKTLLHPVSVTFNPGELVVLLGPNGAGKSTLLHCLAGGVPDSAGDLYWQQQPYTQLSRQFKSQHIALLGQQHQLQFAFTVEEVVALGRLPWNTSSTESFQWVKLALQCFDIIHLQNRNYLSLSGGEQQRVQLARVWVQLQAEKTDTRCLLLDEPLAALDPKHQLQLMNEARQFAHAGHVVVMVLHDMNMAMRFADKVLLLNEGKAVAWGKPADVLIPEQIANVFSLDVTIMSHPDRDFSFVVIN